jgi:hypothetical protein
VPGMRSERETISHKRLVPRKVSTTVGLPDECCRIRLLNRKELSGGKPDALRAPWATLF